MADELRLPDAKARAQGLQVLDKIRQAVGYGRNGRIPMSPQVITDATKIFLEVRHQRLPGPAPGTDAMNHEEGRTIALYAIGTFDSGHGNVLTLPFVNPDTCPRKVRRRIPSLPFPSPL